MAIQVPFLPEEEIEAAANELLARYGREKDPIEEPPIQPDDRLLPFLKLGLQFDDLHKRLKIPRSTDGADILGALWVGDRLVVIDKHLDPELKFGAGRALQFHCWARDCPLGASPRCHRGK